MVQSCEAIYPSLILTSKSVAVPAFDITQDQLVHKVKRYFFFCYGLFACKLNGLVREMLEAQTHQRIFLYFASKIFNCLVTAEDTVHALNPCFINSTLLHVCNVQSHEVCAKKDRPLKP